jgi:hypothetical protein
MNTSNKNKDEFYESQRKIWKALSDGEWHRTTNLKKTTKLSPRTLHKHLKQMVESTTILRKQDLESGKYPIPVLYKGHPELLEWLELSNMRERFKNNIDAWLKEFNNNPMLVLDAIHLWNEIMFVRLLEQIQENKHMTYEELFNRAELELWINFKYFTEKLLVATTKIIDEINIEQLQIEQIRRQKEETEENYKRMEQLLRDQNFQKFMKEYQEYRKIRIKKTNEAHENEERRNKQSKAHN